MVKSSELLEPSRSQLKPLKMSQGRRQRNWHISFSVIGLHLIQLLVALQLNCWWGKEFALSWTCRSQICRLECQRKPSQDHTSRRVFQPGDPAMVKDCLNCNRPWIKGVIQHLLGPVTYQVMVGDLFWKRHVD